MHEDERQSEADRFEDVPFLVGQFLFEDGGYDGEKHHLHVDNQEEDNPNVNGRVLFNLGGAGRGRGADNA